MLEDSLRSIPYHHRPLGPATEFVSKVYHDPELFALIHNSVHLIAPPNENLNEIWRHWTSLRIPVSSYPDDGERDSGNMGFEELGQFAQFSLSPSNMNCLSPSPSFPSRFSIKPPMRYGLLAKTIVDKTECNFPDFWLIHTWAPNLSMYNTPDAYYVFEKGVFRLSRYFELMHTTLDIIETACNILHIRSRRSIVLRIPTLGFEGTWGEIIPTNVLNKIHDHYQQRLLHMGNREWLEVRWPQSGTHQTLGTRYNPLTKKAEWARVESNHDPFGKPSHIIDNEYVEYPKDSLLLMVNAWNSNTWIGNGGVLNNHLNGWMVSGGSVCFSMSEFECRPMGYQCVNAAWLHNACFLQEFHERIPFIPSPPSDFTHTFQYWLVSNRFTMVQSRMKLPKKLHIPHGFWLNLCLPPLPFKHSLVWGLFFASGYRLIGWTRGLEEITHFDNWEPWAIQRISMSSQSSQRDSNADKPWLLYVHIGSHIDGVVIEHSREVFDEDTIPQWGNEPNQ